MTLIRDIFNCSCVSWRLSIDVRYATELFKFVSQNLWASSLLIPLRLFWHTVFVFVPVLTFYFSSTLSQESNEKMLKVIFNKKICNFSAFDSFDLCNINNFHIVWEFNAVFADVKQCKHKLCWGIGYFLWYIMLHPFSLCAIFGPLPHLSQMHVSYLCEQSDSCREWQTVSDSQNCLWQIGDAASGSEILVVFWSMA